MTPPRSSATTDASKLSFPLQLVIFIVSAMLAAGATSWVTRSDLRSIAEEQVRMSRSINAIESKLPNKEVLDERLARHQETTRTLDMRITNLETYMQDLREKLARKGI